ncbi:MAG: phosphoglycerate kinase, partial [Candidatus Cryptobacteroides sp.]
MQQHIDSYDFAGKKAIVRVDFNVPLDENFNITDDTRIRAALPTLKKVLASGGALIIMSHLGRPKGVNPKFSLKHIIGHVSECLGVPVQFADDCQAADAQAAALKPGEVLLLENLRFYAEEEGKPRGLAEDATDEEKKAAKAAVKASQKDFVKKLASYADCYINDAFGTAHRAHASTALIAEYFPQDKMFGYLMEKEVKAIDNVLKNAEHPFTAIIGGSKVSSKLGVIKNLLSKVDNLIIGGGMGYTFIKAQGGKIGMSLHEDELMPDALEILAEAKEKGVNLSLSVATVA